jgi:hypothetical protein
MSYFGEIDTMAGLKEAYRRQVKVLHPDLGGSEQEMKNLNAEYEAASKRILAGEGDTENWDDGFLDAIFPVAAIKELVIEVCGSWVWISGETRKYKDLLKDTGFRWAPKKKMWYWHSGPRRRFRGGTWDMDKIRDAYGSKRYQKNMSSLT